jgi:predicted ABC-type transport system involved in lysophospholipase L1 biosynthesis ATPase subunit/glycosyltransferase involved in cell wall biosynthesis
LKISILAAGSGGMYCGSCMRDNALATALQRQGHQVMLVPLYTPLRTEEQADSNVGRVYYGGINVYLQHLMGLFRHTPRFFDWMLDRAWVLKAAGRLGVQTPPEKLSGLTLSILKGEHGPAMKELHRLVDFLKQDVKPEIVSLPNLMFIGMAGFLGRELDVPVVCELTGEDIFLDAMRPADRERVRQVIRGSARDVSRFVATSAFYADRMADYLAVPREEIDVVYPGIPHHYLKEPEAIPVGSALRTDSSPLESMVGGAEAKSETVRNADPTGGHPGTNGRPLTVGYMARICPEKGLGHLIEAMEVLAEAPGMSDVRLQVGGYVGKRDEKWYKALQVRAAGPKLAGKVTWHGEVTREQKLHLLDSSDVFSAPTPYAEPKGIYVLESLARGVPVVQPAHGSFPELVRQTGGGLLVEPGNARELADALAGLLQDVPRRRELGQAGRKAVEEAFTEDHMARNMVKVYERLLYERSTMLTKTVPGSVTPSVASRSPGLEVSGVRKEYITPAEPLVVLKGVSFSLSSGESMAIVGPSGSGKSTLLNILGTLDPPTSGSVRLDGVDPFTLSASALARFRSGKIGFVFQDHHLLPQLTAAENVLIAKLAEGNVSDADAVRAADLLRRVGLEGRATHLPAELSGGERQRVAIARALMNGPLLLLCDEPTGNLDAHTAASVADLLFALAKESTAIMIAVTHSPQLAERFGRRMRMNEGELVAM